MDSATLTLRAEYKIAPLGLGARPSYAILSSAASASATAASAATPASAASSSATPAAAGSLAATNFAGDWLGSAQCLVAKVVLGRG